MPAGKAKESRAYCGPSRYVQGPGEINNLPTFAANYGNTVLAIIDPFFYETWSKTIPELFEKSGMTAYTVCFGGACSTKELQRLVEFTAGLPAIPDTFIGIGGGQTCDINKAVGSHFGKCFINVPTSLATDAPTSTHTILNDPGQLPGRIVHNKNPDFVVVDTEITVQSPVIMLISGIGDALATFIEAEASYANNNVCNAVGGKYRQTRLGMAVAELSYHVLLEKGRAAVLAAKHHIRTAAYEDVAEATILLSGVGFESTGTSIAHGLQAGFHILPCKPMLHGLGVGYGLLVQLIVQNQQARFEEIFRFCKDVGLPVCTKDLGLTEENRDEEVRKLTEEVYKNRWDTSNVPQHISPEILANAIFYLDAYAAQQ